jgi:hypothetical protein
MAQGIGSTTPRSQRLKPEHGTSLQASPPRSSPNSSGRHEDLARGQQQRAVVEASAIASLTMGASVGGGSRRGSRSGLSEASGQRPRDGEGDASWLRALLLARLKELPRAQCIWVPALDQATMVDLVTHRLSLSGPLPFRTAAIVWERSAGHPLLALEVTWEMVRSKLISLAGGECKESHELLAFRSEELKLPSSMAAVAAARIDQLTMRQQMIVKIASVFFGPFRKEQLVQLCREANLLSGADSEVEAIVTAELLSLTRGGIVQVGAAAQAGGGHYSFVLRQLEDRAYSLLTYRLRQRLHRKVAELLQSVGTPLRRQAFHLIKAESWLPALDLLDECGMTAMKLHAYNEAAHCFMEIMRVLQNMNLSESSEVAEVPRARIAHWHLNLGLSHHELGSLDEALHHYNEVQV